ncbi:PREDICTED: GPI mannosyltransferase 1 [Drosophila arizonae]|uniref:GPI alpha-1,4-mannosyltransferase I, catalytic subunit n=1 Tax=Drosophila arizonae TaxID=7263 RepID=A0ABM1PEU4_DROAR|nr:PREDICTED: GPI mannosyltransferase 1 [Drosophila arizonae]
MSEQSKKSSWLQDKGQNLLNLNIQSHLVISAVLRLMLIFYAQVHDNRSTVPYTDIDYKVITDGARLVLIGDTPFARHTYRYSPILAYIQIPNVILHPAIGKLIYGLFDLLLGLLIYALVRLEFRTKELSHSHMKYERSMKISSHNPEHRDEETTKIACVSACLWLYNPLTAVISTRGNGDSMTGFFVILNLYLLMRTQHSVFKFWIAFCAGFVHGFVIHLRLYPIVFSLTYYLAISGLSKKPLGLLQKMFPNTQQIYLIIGTLIGLVSFTSTFYFLYGWKYIYEAYLYHLIRKDVRHNFSLQFLLQYLTNENGVGESSPTVRFLIVAPQLLLIVYLSFSFGSSRRTLSFCVFTLAFVIVTYNSVVTSQYFIWYLAVLPVCIRNLKTLSLAKSTSLLFLWLCGQAFWLLPGYLLEFQSWPTFYWIGTQSAIFFVINSYILSQLISHFEP